jgi:hypothetical protein
MTDPSVPTVGGVKSAANPDGGPLSPVQVRWLQIAIVVMGIMIVLGILGVVARMFYLASNRASQPVRSVAGTGAAVADARVLLPAGATVKSIALDGDRLVLHFDAPTGAGITIVDVGSGRVVSRLRLEPEPPR